jgi:hypothetical protein
VLLEEKGPTPPRLKLQAQRTHEVKR